MSVPAGQQAQRLAEIHPTRGSPAVEDFPTFSRPSQLRNRLPFASPQNRGMGLTVPCSSPLRRRARQAVSSSPLVWESFACGSILSLFSVMSEVTCHEYCGGIDPRLSAKKGGSGRPIQVLAQSNHELQAKKALRTIISSLLHR